MGVKIVMVPVKLKIVKQAKSVAPSTEAFVDRNSVKKCLREKHAINYDSFSIESALPILPVDSSIPEFV